MSFRSDDVLRERVLEDEILAVLARIKALPNRRERPKPGDLEGDFDLWFDGGAVKVLTGVSHCHFADGTRVHTFGPLYLNLRIEFADGRAVEVRQTHGRSPVPRIGP
ncbi:MAG: hypothetical protein IT454_03920 [Planctomycetes bacterium]|nr:hypothetical protein [Planctomycetota bacterium]